MTHPLKKMILVDDDEDILKIAQFSLEGMPDLEIKFFRSGQEALAEAMNFHPDLMLVDVMMPVMDGIALVHAMKLIPSLSQVPVVFLTAKIQKEEIEKYYKIGVLDVITKPFDPMTLPSEILKIWEKNEKKLEDSR